LGKAIIFWANANFWGQKPAAKYEKSIMLNEKTEFIPSSEMKCPKSVIFINNYSVE